MKLSSTTETGTNNKAWEILLVMFPVRVATFGVPNNGISTQFLFPFLVPPVKFLHKILKQISNDSAPIHPVPVCKHSFISEQNILVCNAVFYWKTFRTNLLQMIDNVSFKYFKPKNLRVFVSFDDR